MSKKHDRTQSTKKSNFRERITLDGLGSASSWSKFNLQLFKVKYTKHECSPLPPQVLPYYVKDETTEVGLRMSPHCLTNDRIQNDYRAFVRRHGRKFAKEAIRGN